MTININGTTGISGVDGSAGTPAIQGSDTNTGVFFGTNTIDLSTDGTSRLSIGTDGDLNVDSGTLFVDASTNRVGIGTTSPISHLHVDGTGSVTMRVSSSDNSLFIQAGASSGSTFHEYKTLYRIVDTDNGERARFDSSGRLLVGATSARTNIAGGTQGVLVEGSSSTNSQNRFTEHVFNANNAEGPYLGLAKTRSTAIGGNAIVQSGDYLGGIYFHGNDGSDFKQAAKIEAQVDGTPGTNDMPGKITFLTTPDGDFIPVERFRLQANGVIGTGSLYNRTTAAAANVYVDSGTDLYRSTSSIKYKTDVETLQDSYADAILNVRPVWYRSTCEGDCHDHSWWGFIAEEVAEIDPRLVHWKTKEITYDEKGVIVPEPCEPEPEGVAYERFVPHLLNLIKRQKEAIETLEARLSVLEGGAN